ncbi:Phage anti-repressor protein [Serratia marcescens]|uniref:antA/AntB antirepressor family protein n=1 Tax=Serratia marcescens TaxID=615 RepID=UPI00217B7643|nr:antA/AntB antirepressor family protein [Serratia marcescens]CAI1534209.1 Phage anti-repressor protein [Serratia marcescens]
MNSPLIPVFNGDISNEPALLCDARELHRQLEVGKRFASWIKERIDEYGFVENLDYILISQIRETKTGRGGDRRSKDYHLTLDTAKELAMVEQNEKGRQVRRYFINCEKQLRNNVVTTQQNNDYRNCRVLHTYNELGVIVKSRMAKSNEDLTSPENVANILRKRGWVMVQIDSLKSERFN